MTDSAVDFALIFNALGMPVMILEPEQLTIVAASSGYLQTTMRSADDIIGKYLFDAFPDDPDDQDVSGTTSLKQSIERVIATRKPHTMGIVRYPIPRPPEQGGGFVERFWQVTNSPIFNPKGELQYLLHAVVDVTAQVRAEQTAEQASTLARLAGRFAKLGWWRYTITPAQLFWSDETAAIHDEEPGFAPEVADAISFYKPDYRTKVAEAFTCCLEQGIPFDLVTELVTAKGRELWVRSIGEAERDATGKIVAVRGAFQDITDLVEARTLATQVNQQLKETLEHISDAFFMLDHDWRFVFVNHQAERLLQTTEQTLIGHTIWERFPEAVGTVFEQEYRRAISDGVTTRFTEFYEPLNYWVEVNAYPSKDGLAVYFRDVTAQIEVDERLRQAQKMEAVGQLTGGVAHDFNNLLTVILGNAELIAAQLPEEHRLRALAEMTVNAAERGSELTNRLLAFARRQPLEPKPTQVNALLDNMLPLLQRTLSEGIKIDYLPNQDLWLTEVDAPQLESAVLNLAINARDAMDGQGKLTIETRNTQLDDSYSELHGEIEAGDYTAIMISDTGSGMKPEVIRQAFEPFFTTKERGKGSGLGLSMVYGFVKQSHGHIKIYSEVGHGTTVKIYLPRCFSSSDNVATDPSTAIRQGGNESILVVEDDDLVRQHVISQLKELGYQVQPAHSGDEALRLLESYSFDLLFSDVVMPGELNGPKLVALAQQRYPDMKVLFTSGYTENAIVHHGRLDPGVKLLSKPYRRQELADKIREALDS
ncbi:PAS domain-containing protein [Pseudidiomarina sp. CB1]|uniref:PAS domain-containing hybrid sensor histidine kinase/response regulator n=1 Tax=Pseudidiomarina sp. CB1 TaxID=2972484 RepID=UPI00216257E2|nr:PAS domain-containing protein [Pseudidiomarina sp. CB1]